VQGEEYRIVLVSLVRSQPESLRGNKGRGKQIVFIGEEDRINVTLSRAKQGLIVMDNFLHLQTYSPEWEIVLQQVDAENLVNRVSLNVVKQSCKNPTSTLDVAKTDDFDQVPNGGCNSNVTPSLNAAMYALCLVIGSHTILFAVQRSVVEYVLPVASRANEYATFVEKMEMNA